MFNLMKAVSGTAFMSAQALAQNDQFASWSSSTLLYNQEEA